MKKNDINLEIIIEKLEIEKRCKELAFWINEHFLNSKRLVIVGLLKGALQFLFEVLKNVNIPYEIDYLSISSFNGQKKPLHEPIIKLDIDIDIKDSDVLIVDEIIDTGFSLKKVIEKFNLANPNSIKIMTLLNKQNSKVDISPDVYGFKIEPNFFYVGFGLDNEYNMRSYPHIAILK